MTVVGARVHVFALLVLVFQLLFLKCELCDLTATAMILKVVVTGTMCRVAYQRSNQVKRPIEDPAMVRTPVGCTFFIEQGVYYAYCCGAHRLRR
jgi:hypothetical protein